MNRKLTTKSFIEKAMDQHGTKYDYSKVDYELPSRWVVHLPELNTCIEYDGQQHFTSVDYWGGYKTLEKVKKNEMKLKINIAKKMVSV